MSLGLAFRLEFASPRAGERPPGTEPRWRQWQRPSSTWLQKHHPRLLLDRHYCKRGQKGQTSKRHWLCTWNDLNPLTLHLEWRQAQLSAVPALPCKLTHTHTHTHTHRCMYASSHQARAIHEAEHSSLPPNALNKPAAPWRGPMTQCL